ncbi:MAG: iron-containing alcohol dehydrogenase [Prolixibacteraceae bacterium]
MNISFKFATSPAIIFGANKIKLLPELVKQFGHRALIVTGKSTFLKSFIAIELFQDFEAHGIETQIIRIEGEPSPEQIDRAVSTHRKWNPDVVVAIGGGSAMDAGKAISAMLCENNSVSSYLEDVGNEIPSGNKLPLIAIPTTAGTGSEATKNAVITKAGADGFKKSLRHDNYVPNLALVDPQLCVTCPPTVTAASGMDAFTQLLESYLSSNSNPMTDALALEGMSCLIRSIEKAVEQGNDLAARSDMSYAALLSGITLANAGLGVVHGFAQPLGSLYNLPHGVACGTLMGAANRITVEKLKEDNNQQVLKKYEQVAQLFSSAEKQENKIDDLLNYIDRLSAEFRLPKLADFGISAADFPEIIAHTGLKNHPINLNPEDLTWILTQRL